MGQMPELDDHRLLAEFIRGRSETAFTELVRRYAGLVHSTAFRFCGNPHHAEEITQAVFVILARKAETLSPRVVVSGWLYQTARLTAANFVKGEMRRRRREQEAVMQSNLQEPDSGAGFQPAHICQAGSLTHYHDWGKIAPLLDEAMGALGETDRNAVLLRFFENHTSSEIGVALRMTEETARKRVNRALEKLRHFFVKRGVMVSNAALSGAISANSVQPISAFMVKSISTVAVAKGAAASASTLTLIKGALKIMAWTKVKTTVVVGVVAILATTSTTVIGIKLARAHHAPPDTTVLSPLDLNATADIQTDGTVLFQFVGEETNGTSRMANADSINDAQTISRVADKSGKPMKFTKRPQGGFYLFLNKPVPPGGKVSYSVEGTVANGMIQVNGANEREIGFTADVGNLTEAHVVEVWRLPMGATLLEKNREMEETTNAGQIELRIDKILPPNGRFPVGFRYRLAAATK